MIKVIGICAEGPRMGKDTLFELLNKIEAGTFLRYAFADELKLACDSITYGLLRIDYNTCKPADKEIIRPIWIAVGEAARKVDPLIWVNKVDGKINIEDDTISVITDVRYRNEAEFFKNKYGNKFMLVEVNKPSITPPPDTELAAFPLLKQLVDVRIDWPDANGDKNSLMPYAEKYFTEYLSI